MRGDWKYCIVFIRKSGKPANGLSSCCVNLDSSEVDQDALARFTNEWAVTDKPGSVAALDEARLVCILEGAINPVDLSASSSERHY